MERAGVLNVLCTVYITLLTFDQGPGEYGAIWDTASVREAHITTTLSRTPLR
jgi:hypothetical protein